jgi:hypothetical protein
MASTPTHTKADVGAMVEQQPRQLDWLVDRDACIVARRVEAVGSGARRNQWRSELPSQGLDSRRAAAAAPLLPSGFIHMMIGAARCRWHTT